jgi:hypothetical protein
MSVENRDVIVTDVKPLTKAQTEFLESYFEDILFGKPELMDLPEEEAIKLIATGDFDDAMAQPAARVRVAKNLNELGLFSEFDAHPTVAGTHVYLAFSLRGAETVYGLLKSAAAEGRLTIPSPAPVI